MSELLPTTEELMCPDCFYYKFELYMTVDTHLSLIDVCVCVCVCCGLGVHL